MVSEDQRPGEFPATFSPNHPQQQEQAQAYTHTQEQGYVPEQPHTQEQQQQYQQQHEQQHEQQYQHQWQRQLNYPLHPSHIRHDGQPMAIRANGIQPISLDQAMMHQAASTSPMAQLHPSSNTPSSVLHTANPIAIASPPWQTAPAQDLSDVARLTQMWTDRSQRRNETSQRPIDSFDWYGSVLMNQGLPVVDRQYMVPDSNNVSSMDVWPENFSIQDSADTQYSMDQWINGIDAFSPHPFAAQSDLAIGCDYFNIHGCLDNRVNQFQNGDRRHITSHFPSSQEYRQTISFGEQLLSLDVKLGVEQMIESLTAQCQQITLGLGVSGDGHSIPSPEDENPQTPSDAEANADMQQEHHSGACDPRFSFICPYVIKYPNLVTHKCFQRLRTIPYLKQHLRSVHHDAKNCPHKCEKRKPGARESRRSISALYFGTDICPEIKRRSDRSKTHKQQWERIFQILFPEANLISGPSIDCSTIKQLRNIYKFMENDGIECLARVYDQLPDIRLVYPEPKALYGIVFCIWLSRVSEQLFSPQEQQSLSEYFNQLKSVENDNTYTLDETLGFSSQENSASFSPEHQVERQDPSPTPIPPHLETVLYQSHYFTVPTVCPMQQQLLFQTMVADLQQNYSTCYLPQLSSATQPQPNVECAAPTPGVQGPEHESFHSHDFLFDKCSPMNGSPSQLLQDIHMDIEDINISQTSTGDSDTWQSFLDLDRHPHGYGRH
jgi:hypothetical protein